MTSDDIYERLAAVLEALPHGFPRTPSGVEIRLIKMAFTPEEASLAGHLTRIPETAAEIAQRVGELPRDREIAVICRSPVRAYYATRILLQNGFKARNISGGMLSRSMLAREGA
jgi:rhodanese-related sulfurtransferase